MLTKEECLEAYNNLYDGSYDTGHDFKVDYDVIKQLINEHFDNPPLKFEELHDKMWVWDNKYKEYCYIYFIAGVYPHRKYIDNCESKFEENRFYLKEVKEDV